MLNLVSNLVSFVAVYTCLDAVVVDLDGEDAIPPRFKEAKAVDSAMLEEFIDLLGDGEWKTLQQLASKNIYIDWLHSKAYQRDIFKLTAYVNYPRVDVVDAFWLEEVSHSSWNHVTFMDSKVLDYAGDNRVIIWNKARPPRGQEAFISPRDGVYYMSNVGVLSSSNFGSDEIETKYKRLLLDPAEAPDVNIGKAANVSIAKASVILGTNTTAFGFNYPEQPDSVRGQAGTCGMLFVDYPQSAPQAGTKIMWIANGESYPPSFIPGVVVRRLIGKTMSTIIDNLKKYLESNQQATRALSV